MRIISGIYKGRKLKSPPKNAKVRPTTDRVKETLFNILSNRIDFEDVKIIDLFCGTGSFGIECLSRGSTEVTFVDMSTVLVKENLELIDETTTEIIRSDAIKFLQKTENVYTIIFADPPYEYKEYDKLINTAREKCSLFILEHSSKKKFDSTELVKDFGDTSLSFFHQENRS